MANEMTYDKGMPLGELDKSWSSGGATVKDSAYNKGGSGRDDIPRSSGKKGRGSSFGKY